MTAPLTTTTPATREELDNRARLLREAVENALRADDKHIRMSTNGALWMAKQLAALSAARGATEELKALLAQAAALLPEPKP